MQDEQRTKRRNAVRWAIQITRDTPLAPGLHERQLLAKYLRGILTIDQVLELLKQQE